MLLRISNTCLLMYQLMDPTLVKLLSNIVMATFDVQTNPDKLRQHATNEKDRRQLTVVL